MNGEETSNEITIRKKKVTLGTNEREILGQRGDLKMKNSMLEERDLFA